MLTSPLSTPPTRQRRPCGCTRRQHSQSALGGTALGAARTVVPSALCGARAMPQSLALLACVVCEPGKWQPQRTGRICGAADGRQFSAANTWDLQWMGGGQRHPTHLAHPCTTHLDHHRLRRLRPVVQPPLQQEAQGALRLCKQAVLPAAATSTRMQAGAAGCGVGRGARRVPALAAAGSHQCPQSTVLCMRTHCQAPGSVCEGGMASIGEFGSWRVLHATHACMQPNDALPLLHAFLPTSSALRRTSAAGSTGYCLLQAVAATRPAGSWVTSPLGGQWASPAQGVQCSQQDARVPGRCAAPSSELLGSWILLLATRSWPRDAGTSHGGRVGRGHSARCGRQARQQP
jgi:hypothetical protein